MAFMLPDQIDQARLDMSLEDDADSTVSTTMKGHLPRVYSKARSWCGPTLAAAIGQEGTSFS